MDPRLADFLESPNVSPLPDLEAVFLAEERWAELLRLYEAGLERAPADPRVGEWIEKGLRILDERLDDAPAAERWLRRWDGLASAHERLQAIYEARGDEQALCDLLEREAAHADTPEQAAGAYCRLGESLERMGRLQRAVQMWQRALRLVPEHRDSLSRMRAAYVQLGRFDLAQAVVEREADHFPDESAAHAKRLVEIARVALEQPYRHEQARHAADAALAIDPGCGEARLVIASIDALAAGWRDQVRELRARAADERDRKAAARIYLQIASLHAAFDRGEDVEERLQDPLRRAFFLWPAMPDALEFLERRFAQRGDFEGLARAYEALAKNTSDKPAKVELLLRLASVFEIRFDDRARSLSALLEAMIVDPARVDVLTQLARLLEEEERYDELARILEKHVAAAPTRTEARVRLGELYAEKLSDPAQARIHLRAALEQDPDDVRAARLLRGLMEDAAPATFSAPEAAEEAPVEADPGLEERLEKARGEDRAPLLDQLASRETGERRVELLRELLQLRPEDASVRRRLADSLAALENWEEQADVLAKLDEDDARLQRGLLLAEKLERPEEAVELLLAVQQARPQESRAALLRLARRGLCVERIADALSPLLEEEEEWTALAALLEARLEIAAGSERQRAALALAECRADRLADPRGAFAILARLFAEAPDETLLSRLSAQAAAFGGERELARLCRDAWDQAGAALSSKLARLAIAHAGDDRELSRAAHRQLLSLEKDDADALLSLAHLEADANRWPEATELLERRMALDPNPALELLRADWLMRQGAHGHAAEALRAAMERGAPEAEVLPKLAEALEASGRQEELAAVVGRLAELAPDPATAARLSLQKAQILGALQHKDEAVQGYAEVLERNPADEASVAALEAMLDDPEAAPAAARVLRRAYEAAGAHEKLRRALELLIEAAPDPATRVRELRQLAQLAGRELRQPRLAFQALGRAFAEAPGDALLRSELRVAAGQAGALSELAELVSETASRQEGALAIALERELAELYEKRLAQPDRAELRWARVHELDPKNAEALRALVRLRRDLGAWEPFFDVALALSSQTFDPRERTSLYREAAKVAAETLQDPQRTLQALQPILEAEPDDVQALAVAERAYELLDRSEERRAVLERLVEKEPTSERRIALARLLAGEDRERALSLLAEALPQSEEVLQAWALEPEGADALLVLDALLAAGGDHAGRVALRERRLPVASEDERITLHRELRSLQEKELGRPELAFLAAFRAFSELRLDREELERLARETDSLEELTELYDELGEPETLRRAAELSEVPDEALSRWMRLLELQPEDDAAQAAALELLAKAGRHAELVELLCRRAEQKNDAALWARAADVCAVDLEDPARALSLARRAKAIDPACSKALELLVLYLHETHERDELLEALLALAKSEEVGSDRRLSLLDRAARLRLDGGQGEESLSLTRQILQERPGDRACLQRLEELLADEEAGPRAAELLEESLGAGEDADAKLRLALAFRDRFGEPERALSILEKLPEATAALQAWAQSEAPLAARACRALDDRLTPEERIALREARLALPIDDDEKRALFDELRAIREEQGRPELAFVVACRAFSARLGDEALFDHLERLAEATSASEELAELYEEASLFGRAAAIFERVLSDGARALTLYERMLQRGHDDDAYDGLLRLHAAAGRRDEQVEVLRRRAETDPDPLRWLVEAAQLARDAAPLWRRVLEYDSRHAPALRALCTLLDPRADREELRLILERRLELEDSLELRVQHARLLEGEAALAAWAALAREEEAAAQSREALFALLDDEALAPQVVEVLEPLLREASDGARLCRLLELRLRLEGESEALLQEIASLREKTGDADGAFHAALRLFRAAPGDADRLEDALRLAGESFRYEELATALEEAARELSEGEALPLLARLASIYEERLDRPAAAAAAWERLAEAKPGESEPLDALDRLYRATRETRALCSVLQRRVAIAAELERRKDLWFEMATLLEDQLDDREGAIEVYEAVLAADPDDPEAFTMLSRLLGETQRWEDVDRLVAARIDTLRAAGDAAEARELESRLGRIRFSQLGDARGATALYARVLAEAPRHPATLSGLDAMVQSGDAATRAAAAALLAPIFAEERDWQRHVEMIDAQALVAQGADAAALHRKASEVYQGPLDSVELAFVAATRALQADPDDPENLSRVIGLAELSRDLAEELSGVLATAVEAARSDEGRVALLRAQAHRAKDPAAARAAWERLRQVEPQDEEALAALARLHGDAGDVDGQIEALRLLAERTEDRALLRQRLLELATLQEERKRDLAGALHTLRRLLESSPDDLEALMRLDVLCVRQERWIELSEVLSKEAELAGASGDVRARLGFLFRLGQLKETHLLDREGALALYRQVLEVDPRHTGARLRVEAQLEAAPRDLELIEVLEKVSRATEDWLRTSDLIEARAAAAADPEARKRALDELAELQATRLRRIDLSFLTLARAFREEPSDRALWGRLFAAAEASESTEEWLALLEEEHGRLDPDSLVLLAAQVAPLCERSLGDEAAALRWYERARALGNRDAALALERLHRAGERWEQLAEILDWLAETETDPEEKVAQLFRFGRLAEEKLDSPQRAAMAYERMLLVEPNNLPALRALEPIYEARRDNAQLYRNLAAQAEATPEGAARLRLVARLAEVAAARGDAETAIEHWHDVLQKNPRHPGAAEALEGLLDGQGRWEELATLLQSRLDTTLDPRELVTVGLRLGRLQAERLERFDDAAKTYRVVLDREPRNREALLALAGLHRERQELEPLVAVLRRLVSLQDDPAGVKEVRLELAETLAQLGRREEAVESGKRALDLEPHDLLQLQRVELLFREVGAWSEVIRAMELQAPLLDTEPDLVVDLWNGIARIWEDELHRREGAAAALEKILELRPDAEAFAKLREIYQSVADWRRWALATERQAAALAESDRALLLRELAKVLETRLGQPEIAFARLGAAFDLQPDDAELLREMLRLADVAAMHEELALIVENVAESQPPGPLAIDLLLHLSRLQEEKLDDADAAEESLGKILLIDPAHPAALERLASLYARRGEDRALVQALERQLEFAGDAETRRSLLQRIAKVQEQKLEDIDAAVRALSRAHEMEPGESTSFEALAALLERHGRYGELRSLLVRVRDLASTDEEVVSLQIRLAVLCEERLEDDESAIGAWARVLDHDPANARALDALDRLYTTHDRVGDLLRVIERKLQHADVAEQGRLCARAAAIYEEKLGDVDSAIAMLDRAAALEPDNRSVLRDLEVVLRKAERHGPLAEVLRRHEGLLVGRDRERAEMLARLGEVLFASLGQNDEAEVALRQALQLDGESLPALSLLSRLCEARSDWEGALDCLEREARLRGSVPESASLHHRIGVLRQHRLGDAEGAERSFSRALAIDPTHLPTLRALRELAEARGDEDAVAEALAAEANATSQPEERAERLFELGSLRLRREDPDGALRAFEEARRSAPEHLQANLASADLYVEREAWPQAATVLEVVCRLLSQPGADPAGELAGRVYRLGFVYERLQDEAKALSSYGRAYELDPTLLPAAEGLARLLESSGDEARALKVYQAILIHHRDDLSDPEVVELHHSIGALRHKLGEADAALKSLRNALELDPWHVEAHRALVGVAEELGDLALAVSHRQKLVELLDGEEKLEALLQLGQVALERAKDPYLAIDAYANALRLQPDALDLHEQLAALYRETKQGPRAVEILERLLAHPDTAADPARQVRCHLQLGEYFATEHAGDASLVAKAVEHFDAALDLDWKQTRALEAIEALLAATGDYRALEAHYVKMLQRLPKEEGTRAARVLLYRTLGELYREALNDPAAAAEAFKAVTLLAPDDPQAARAYAELASLKPGAEAEAIAAWRKLLPTTDDLLGAARALERLHARKRSYDGAYVAASVVCELLGKVSADEAGIMERLKGYTRTTSTGAIEDRHWTEQIYHPALKGQVGQILALVHEHAGAIFSSEHGQLVVQGREVKVDRKRDRVDPGAGLFFVNAYHVIARAAGMQPLELYKVQGVAGLHLVPTWPLSLVAGEDVFADTRKKELYFAIGRNLAFARPELAPARLHFKSGLEDILQAAVSLGEPRAKTSTDPRILEKIRKRLEKALPPAAQQQLQKLAYAYARERNRQPLAAYAEAAEMTANRAGALFCADLLVAKKSMAAEGGAAAELSAQVRERDLAVFALSDVFSELRRKLGIAVKIPDAAK